MSAAQRRTSVLRSKTSAQAEFTSAEHVKFQRGSPRSWLRGVKTGYLARYAKLVSSADKGAILEL